MWEGGARKAEQTFQSDEKKRLSTAIE
jgi:hypothetical protein